MLQNFKSFCHSVVNYEIKINYLHTLRVLFLLTTEHFRDNWNNVGQEKTFGQNHFKPLSLNLLNNSLLNFY
jgi:hypothetical protein